MFPRKPHEMPPLRRARREQPRVLADPDKRAHRIAVKLARIAAGNAKANQPRLFGARAWDSQRMLNRGQRFIRTGMELVMPLIENRLAAWNERCEPG